MIPYERIGGRDGVQALASGFYDLVDLDERYAELRALHGHGTGEVRQAFGLWLAAWLGGPVEIAGSQGCIMSRHRAMRFGPALADQWLDAMERTVERIVHDPQLATAMLQAMTGMARAMVVVES